MMQRYFMFAMIFLAAQSYAVPVQPADSGKVASQTTELTRSQGAPVVFRNDTLFTVFSRVGPYKVEDRATAIAKRLEELAPHNGELTVVESKHEESYSTIQISGKRVALITDEDGAGSGQDRRLYAAGTAEAIQMAFAKPIVIVLPPVTIREVLLAILATSALIFLLRVLNAFYPILVRLIAKLLTKHKVKLQFQTFEILSYERAYQLVFFLLRMTRIGIGVFLGYFYLVTVLGLFPGTADLAKKLGSYFWDPATRFTSAFVDYLPNLFSLVVITAFLMLAIRLVRRFAIELSTGRIGLPGFYTDWAMPTFKLVRLILVLLALVIAYPFLPGSDSVAFKGVSVFLGVLLSLGSSSAVANMVAGIVLTYMRPFRIGDRVKISDTVGDVVEKTLLVTRIRTLKLENVTIPNTSILGGYIVNYSNTEHGEGNLVHTSVTIGYDVPWKQVHQLLISAAESVPGISRQTRPFVLQRGLGDFSVEYEINLLCADPQLMVQMYSDLHAAIQDKFNEAGVEIMSPAFTALRDGNRVTLPDESLPKDYKAPGFRIDRTN